MGDIRRTALVAAALAGLALVASGCQPRADFSGVAELGRPAAVAVPLPTQSPQARLGEALLARACPACPAPRLFADATFIAKVRRTLTPREVYSALTDGRAELGVPEPLKTRLTPDERWHVVFYLWSLGGTPRERADATQLFVKNCAMCHGARGGGDGSVGKTLQPRPADFTNFAKYSQWNDVALFQFISGGKPGTAMPPWKGVLSEEERWKLVDHLRTFLYDAGD